MINIELPSGKDKYCFGTSVFTPAIKTFKSDSANHEVFLCPTQRVVLPQGLHLVHVRVVVV